MNTINLSDKVFEIFISNLEIYTRTAELAKQINLDFQNKTPVIIGVLNGCFMFMANLVAQISTNCEVSFVKVSSYQGGTKSSGKVDEILGLAIDIAARDVIIVEDIVDTGKTLQFLISKIETLKPASVKVATLLLKPDALETQIPQITYVGFEIENKFVVGYGMDYNNLGRNLNDIYKLC
ncbi:MAG: hypoxanthine phosphoribosyltransferase [Sphingobacteriales bacterium]|nr:MAG: hypoxanthine phosphoribosyltransferase [Sphingobacteriales bacterium]